MPVDFVLYWRINPVKSDGDIAMIARDFDGISIEHIGHEAGEIASKRRGATQHYNKLDNGAHFATCEQRELFSAEVSAGFRSLG